MKTFLIVLVMMVNAKGHEDLYIIQEPTFAHPNQCIAYVQTNTNEIVGRAQLEYNGRPVKDIFCVEEEKLNSIIHGQEV